MRTGAGPSGSQRLSSICLRYLGACELLERRRLQLLACNFSPRPRRLKSAGNREQPQRGHIYKFVKSIIFRDLPPWLHTCHDTWNHGTPCLQFLLGLWRLLLRRDLPSILKTICVRLSKCAVIW